MSNETSPTLLVVDDEPGHRMLMNAVLSQEGWRVVEAGDGEEGLAAIHRENPDVILLDMKMPRMDGPAMLTELLARGIPAPVIMLTAFGTVGSAVAAIKDGAYDYLTKPADNDELVAVVNRALDYARLTSENARLRRQAATQNTADTGTRLVGTSHAMQQVRQTIDQVAPSEATVLITGESGTGKEVATTLLHERSTRASGPLITVNCAALPPELLESELFGYRRGAFTGATTDKPGRFQLASGGTLFLDEIGEMDPLLQAKLLRVLQEREVEPLGGTAPVAVDVRVVAATNRDLLAEVRAGRFREDLYFRLAVITLHLPPLRERIEDLPLLAGHLLQRLGKRNHREGVRISPRLLEVLMAHRWPGNVRELANVLERALVLARTDELTVTELPPDFGSHAPAGTPTRSEPSGDEATESAERARLEHVLATHGGHRQKTADALGMSRRTLQYKLKHHGLTKR